MNQDLSSYIKLYNNKIPKNICQHSIDYLKNVSWNNNEFYDYKNNSIININDSSKSWDGDCSINKTLMDISFNTLKEYVTELNFSWFCSWSGISHPRYNYYKQNSHMLGHCDHIHSLFDGERKGIPTLSIIGCLNENYSGGELEFFNNISYTYKLSVGDIIIFPSNFLYPHKVKVIESGERYSYAIWAW
jgi:hypothetical protein